MKVKAIAQRSGEWWAVSAPDVDGLFTQARRLDQIPAMVADAVELLEGVPADQVDVEVVPQLTGDLARETAQALEADELARAATERATAARRQLVARLRTEGYTVRDVGTILHVSPQRVSQIEAERPTHRTSTNA